MIVKLTFKDPDCFCSVAGADTDGLLALPEDEQKKIAKFVEWGEYVTVSIDTTKGTAEVIPV